jgi:type IV pilus assembly protein PilO
MTELFRGTVTRQDWAIVGGIVGFAAALCVVYALLVYRPEQIALEQVIATDEQVQADLKVARETERNIDGLRAEAAKMQELVSQFEQRLPESREIPTLLKQFEGFAGEIGLRVELSQLPRVTDAHKETIPYSVVARGNFHQIASFINRLERFQRYLKVSELNIGKEEGGVAEAQFTLSTFRFIQPDEGKKS